jgi:hypothetical protein
MLNDLTILIKRSLRTSLNNFILSKLFSLHLTCFFTFLVKKSKYQTLDYSKKILKNFSKKVNLMFLLMIIGSKISSQQN